jgi:NADH:ubiquinone oxidoreductase subunit 4 (subunit M)
MISFLITIPLFGIFCLLSIPEEKNTMIKQIALLFSSLTFLFSLLFWVLFDFLLSVDLGPMFPLSSK